MANPTELTVQLRLIADTAQLQNSLRGVAGQMRQVGVVGAQAFNQSDRAANNFRSTLRDMIGRFSALWVAFKGIQGVGRAGMFGVEFLAQVEAAKLGISSLIMAQAKLRDASGKELEGRDALNAAYALSEEQLKKLRVAGLETAATTEQLVGAFQDAVGGGLRANLSLDQIRELTVRTVQAAGAMNVPMNQLNQEIRSILDGTIDRNSRVAVRLGINNEMVKQWTQAGTLFENLYKRMEAFSVAGRESMNNWTVVLSNMTEAAQIVMGEITKVPFNEVKQAIKGVMDSMLDTSTGNIAARFRPVVEMGKDIAAWIGRGVVATIRAVGDAVQWLAKLWAENRVELNKFLGQLGDLARIVADVLGAALKMVVSLLVSLVSAFVSLPAPLQAGTLALGVFVATLLRIISVSYGGLFSGLAAIASNLLNVARGGTTAAAAMGSFAKIIGPGGMLALGIGVIAGVVLGVNYLRDATARAAEAASRLSREQGDAAKQQKGLAADYLQSLESLEQITPGTTAYNDELSRANGLRSSLVALNPKWREALERAGVSVAENTKVLKAMNDEIARGLRLKRAELEIELAKQDAEVNRYTRASRGEVGQVGFFEYVRKAGLGAEDYQTILTRLRATADTTRQAIVALNAALAVVEEKPGAGPTLDTNPPPPGADEQARLEELANARRQWSVKMHDLETAAIRKTSLAEQERIAIRNALNESMERENFAFKNFSGDELNQKLNENARLAEEEIDRIRADFQAKRLESQERFEQDMDELSSTTLDRRLARLRNNIERTIDLYNQEQGITLSAEQRQAAIQEAYAKRSAVEIARFRDEEVDKLEAELRELEQQQQITFSPEGKVEAIQEIADRLGISAEAVAELTAKLREQDAVLRDWQGGWQAGLTEWVMNAQNAFQIFKDLATSVLGGVTNAFAQGIEGMISGQMKLGKAFKTIWNGILKTVITAVAQMIAQWLVLKIVGAATAKSQAMSAAVASVAEQMRAAAAIFAAHAYIPFVGPAIAAGLVTMMNGALGANAAAAKTMNAAALFASGGVIDRPTLAIMGEIPGSREIVAPETSFLKWADSLTARFLGDAVAAGRGAFSPADGANGYLDLRGAVIVGDTTEGLKKASKALRVVRDWDERNNG